MQQPYFPVATDLSSQLQGGSKQPLNTKQHEMQQLRGRKIQNCSGSKTKLMLKQFCTFLLLLLAVLHSRFLNIHQLLGVGRPAAECTAFTLYCAGLHLQSGPVTDRLTRFAGAVEENPHRSSASCKICLQLQQSSVSQSAKKATDKVLAAAQKAVSRSQNTSPTRSLEDCRRSCD